MSKRKSIRMVLFAFVLLVTTCIHPNILCASSLKDTFFTVQFKSNGGSTVSTIVNVPYGSTIELPENPTRKGYWFRGWYTDSSLTIPFDDSQKIYKNTTLYAKWQKKSSTPNIMKQSISDGTYSSTVTVDIAGQKYGNACELNLMTYDRTFLKTVVFTQHKTTKYIGFELNINDFVFNKAKPIPVKIKIPASFSTECVQVIYTTNRKTVSAVPDGYINSNNEFVFDAYYSGTYILMETLDNVKPVIDPKTRLAIYSDTNKLKPNSQIDLSYSLLNYNGDEALLNFKWYSSKPYVASISKDGVVTAHHYGQTTISCVATNSKFVTTKTIYVYGRLVKSLKTNVSTKKLKKGKTFYIRSTVSPSNATVKKLTYSSSNKKIATVSGTGKIKAIKKGTCYIKVSTTDGSGKYKKVKVVVY